MSRPIPDFALPKRMPDNRRSGDDPVEAFALTSQGNFLEMYRELERRVARLETLIGRADSVWP